MTLLPRASLWDVLRGRAPWVGTRLRTDRPRGYVSPIEARLHLGIAYGHDLVALEEEALPGAGWGTVLRALATSWLAVEPSEQASRSYVVASAIDDLTVPEALQRVVEAPGSTGRLIHFAHAHALNLATGDAELRAHFAAAHTVLGDGIGIRLASRLLGRPLRDNVNGTDLLPLLCDELAQWGIPLVLVGASPGVAEACAERLRQAHPHLDIPLAHHGYVDDATSQDLVRAIRALGRCVVLVGMGSPRQEAWAHRYLAGLPSVTALTVGGLFDFYSGRIPRAPLAWRELGLEWVWRLLQEPGRLARRYLWGNPLFLARALWQRCRPARR